MNIYGVLNSENIHTDICVTEKGVKRFATLNGFTKVSLRNSNHYNITIIAQKVGKKWQKVN
jgi:hypothetical protein